MRAFIMSVSVNFAFLAVALLLMCSAPSKADILVGRGITVPHPISLSVSVGNGAFAPGDNVRITVSLTNSNARAVVYTFQSSQSVLLEIRDSLGNTVWAWKQAQGFSQLMRKVSFPANSVKRFSMIWNQMDLSGRRARPGAYQVVAALNVVPSMVVTGSVLQSIDSDPANLGQPMNSRAARGVDQLVDTTPGGAASARFTINGN